jgi:UDP-N-acetylmuramate: L-alanyl-gamma-D-glutamyl-meso-diaminopimelate ligase
MHIHILGICGTFMAGVAILAKQQGHHVTGSDEHVYPPMSTQLQEQGIVLYEGYDPQQLEPKPDCVIIGNAMKRGNPAVEYVLNNHLPYMSGPGWLAEHLLQSRHVLAVAGTHGKTTTTSMLAWILDYAGLAPGFLIGGIPKNFTTSSRLGAAPYFVIEADEYDSAFFDKRSKFIHYRPQTVILNNLEFDHADIFPNLDAIKTQFHQLIRTVPSNGLIICPKTDSALQAVLAQGCWTKTEYIGTNGGLWQANTLAADGSEFNVLYAGQLQGTVRWSLLGQHNIQNALAAIAAAHHVGVAIPEAIAALAEFKGVKRRLEVISQSRGITVYDDFAHHPTAIATTLAGLRQRLGKNHITAVLELGSYTMRTGVHKNALGEALRLADNALLALPKGIDWGVSEVAKQSPIPAEVFANVDALVESLVSHAKSGDHIVIMSNTGFDGLHQKLITALQ